MLVNVDQIGVDSTTVNDFFNQISIVSPRANINMETNLYTKEEKLLLTMRPGITDLSSIIFSDEGNILEYSDNPNLDYNQLIRPWKRRLGILYVDNRSLLIDVKLIFLTAVAVISKQKALKSINKILLKLGADEKIISICLRQSKLELLPHPGSSEVIVSRNQ